MVKFEIEPNVRNRTIRVKAGILARSFDAADVRAFLDDGHADQVLEQLRQALVKIGMPARPRSRP